MDGCWSPQHILRSCYSPAAQTQNEGHLLQGLTGHYKDSSISVSQRRVREAVWEVGHARLMSTTSSLPPASCRCPRS